MIRADLVIAVCEDHQAGGLPDAPAQVLEQIQGGLICPVDVFDNENGGLALELGQTGAEQSALCAMRIEQAEQRTAGLQRDITQRIERARCEEQVTLSLEDSPGLGFSFGELLNQACFANPRFTVHESDAALSSLCLT